MKIPQNFLGGVSGTIRARCPHFSDGPGAGHEPGNLHVFSGGNDALSTIIPYQDNFYYSRRPTLAVPSANVLQIGTDSSGKALGLHPRLTGLKQIFDAGHLAIIQRSGYSNSSRSHFLGTDIWSTANPTNTTGSGWLGRYLDQLPSRSRRWRVGARLAPCRIR